MKRWIAVILIPALLLLLAMATGFILLWRLLFLTLLVFLFSFIWMLLAKKSISVQSTGLPDHCRAGQWIEQRITVFNKSSLISLPVIISQNTDMPGQFDEMKVNLASRQSIQKEMKIYCRQRGRYKIGQVAATVTDILGLFSARVIFGEQQNIIVYPAVYDLPEFAPFAHDDYIFRARRWIGSGISSMASRVREYVSGDNLNHIHWRSTAHSGQLMVKVFDPDRATIASGVIWIVLDMHREMKLGKGNNGTDEYAITIAASLATKYNKTGTPVGLIASGSRLYTIPPASGEQQLLYLMELLAEIQCRGNTPVDTLISNSAINLGGNSTVIVITPSSRPELTASLRQLGSRGNTVLAVLLNPASFGARGNNVDIRKNLISNGIQTYVVKNGDNLEAALSSQGIPVSGAMVEP
jgi:uncharacterized protein (DUF58 family)